MVWPTSVAGWLALGVQIGEILAAIAVFTGAFTLIFDYRKGVRDAIRLKTEEWRISYRNLNITHTTVLTHPVTAPVVITDPGHVRAGQKVSPNLPVVTLQTPTLAPTEQTQFLIFQLEVENIGDGPVDVWACLVAARELNAGEHKEAWGGNIEWNDLDAYYYDTHQPEWEHLAGISNTRHLVYSQDDYIALDPKEHDTLTRIDRIDPVARHITLLYRAFLVGRGYGGDSSPQRATRDILAWQRLQQALFNISGPSFRILFDVHNPLELVADRDGFPCFVLYHKGFIDDSRDQIGWTNIDWVNQKLEGEWGRDHDFPDALHMIEEKLAIYQARWRRHWQAFNQAVEQCKKLERGFADLVKSDWRPHVPGEPVDKTDVANLTAKQAFARLPAYLRWDTEDDDGLPMWEKFFVVPLPPGDEMREPRSLDLQ